MNTVQKENQKKRTEERGQRGVERRRAGREEKQGVYCVYYIYFLISFQKLKRPTNVNRDSSSNYVDRDRKVSAVLQITQQMCP